MNNKDNVVAQLIESAKYDLVKVQDPYQHGMLAISLATALMKSGVQVDMPAQSQAQVQAPAEIKGTPVAPKQEAAINDMLAVQSKHEKEVQANEVIPTNEDLQDKPTATAGVAAMNAASQAIADIMNEAAAENNATATVAIKSAPETTAAATPAPTAPANASAEPDYDSEEWANKKLSADELDDTWTPRMQKNNELVMYRNKMQQIIQSGLKSGNINDAWLNQQFNALSGGQITTWRDPRIASPKAVKLFCPPLYKAAVDLMAAKQRNAAA